MLLNKHRSGTRKEFNYISFFLVCDMVINAQVPFL